MRRLDLYGVRVYLAYIQAVLMSLFIFLVTSVILKKKKKKTVPVNKFMYAITLYTQYFPAMLSGN